MALNDQHHRQTETARPQEFQRGVMRTAGFKKPVGRSENGDRWLVKSVIFSQSALQNEKKKTFVRGAPKARAVPGFLKSPAPSSHGAWVPSRNARAGHYCPIAHGLKMRVFIESEVIRWAKSSQ